MKPSYKEVLEQLHEQGIIIDVLERRIIDYRVEIATLKSKKFRETMRKAREAGGFLVKIGKLKPL